MVINNSLTICFGNAGDSTFNEKIITLPITYKKIFSVTTTTKNITNAVNMRTSILSTSQIKFWRADNINITGWYMVIGY